MKITNQNGIDGLIKNKFPELIHWKFAAEGLVIDFSCDTYTCATSAPVTFPVFFTLKLTATFLLVPTTLKSVSRRRCTVIF